ncbi:MAG: hypothetical protein IPM18_00175 [Phycisphaerales bacterium]|nr:hypothetical protein [Phycisphaerales bacterium]
MTEFDEAARRGLWILVERGAPLHCEVKDLDGIVRRVVPLTKTHTDAMRLIAYFQPSPNPPVRPRKVGVLQGETLDSLLALAERADCQFAAVVDMWKADGSPSFGPSRIIGEWMEEEE